MIVVLKYVPIIMNVVVYEFKAVSYISQMT